MSWPAWPGKFQSTPAIAGGRITEESALYQQSKGFNPRPPLLAGESAGHRQQRRFFDRFNPRPPLLAGESLVRGFPAAANQRFNPRPPLLAGESGWFNALTRVNLEVSIHARHCWRANPDKEPLELAANCVSIHARHCWRANPTGVSGTSTVYSVSIHARHCWRANPRHALGDTPVCEFQSTPAIAGGRIQMAFG